MCCKNCTYGNIYAMMLAVASPTFGSALCFMSSLFFVLSLMDMGWQIFMHAGLLCYKQFFLKPYVVFFSSKYFYSCGDRGLWTGLSRTPLCSIKQWEHFSPPSMEMSCINPLAAFPCTNGSTNRTVVFNITPALVNVMGECPSIWGNQVSCDPLLHRCV